MWCTRWYLPLLLLPLPTAPPYLLFLFLVSLTIHAKPCFYCIILLSTLFVSSCYWQPIPLDSPLSRPWSEDITTFAEALNASLSGYNKPLPPTIQAAERCWCDFSAGGFFEPFNLSRWEEISVDKLRAELERQQVQRNDEEISPPKKTASNSTTKTRNFWSLFRPLSRPAAPELTNSSSEEKNSSLPLLRREYDLGEFGVDIVVDFGWKRAY